MRVRRLAPVALVFAALAALPFAMAACDDAYRPAGRPRSPDSHNAGDGDGDGDASAPYDKYDPGYGPDSSVRPTPMPTITAAPGDIQI